MAVKIRIGNDIPIRWAVTRCGVPEDFAGKSLKLYMRTAYSETEVTDFAVSGNVISWTYPGASQKATGTYTFTLVENEGLGDMATVDACDALKLVSCSSAAECAESVEVTSDIDVPANGRTPVLETGRTETLEPGSEATAEVVYSGRDDYGNPVYRLDFGIPEGQPGKTPVINTVVTVTTLEPGSDATASITPDGQDEQGNPKYALSIGVPQGAAFEYSDFTAEQITQLQKPATDAAKSAIAAAEVASTAAGVAATEAKKATDAASAASSAASAASQTNTQITEAEGLRATAEQQRVQAEQTRQQQFTEAKEAAESATEAAQEAADNITTPLDVLAHSDCTLEEKVTALATLLADICDGRVTLPSLNVKRLGVWGENNLIMTGSGAPLTPPDRAGQIYIDTTNNAQYNSTGNNSVSDWKIQN